MPMTAAGVFGVWHLIGGSEVVDSVYTVLSNPNLFMFARLQIRPAVCITIKGKASELNQSINHSGLWTKVSPG